MDFGRLLLAGTLAATGALATPSPARACTPPPPAPQPPCETLSVSTNGRTMPVNAERHIAVRRLSRDEAGYSSYQSVGEEGLEPPLVVERRELDAEDFEAIDYTLADNGVVGLPDVPGEYRIVWPGSTCGELEAETGTGPVLSAVTLTEAVPLPTDLGTVTATWEVATHDVGLGENSLCEPVTEERLLGDLRVELSFADDALAWAGALTFEIHIDGERAASVGGLYWVGPDYTGPLSHRVRQRCGPTGGGARWEQRFLGEREISFVGRTARGEVIVSDTARLTLDCGETYFDPAVASPTAITDGPGELGGCASTEPSGSALFSVLLVAVGWPRRRSPVADPRGA